MSVAVWDTYVKKRDGSVMHFDIIVPVDLKDVKIIHQFGSEYVTSKGEDDTGIDTEECQFCHVEEASADMQTAIAEKGYFILEMDDIPATLPANPTRRDLVLHLRAHYPRYRFANLQGKSPDELREMMDL